MFFFFVDCNNMFCYEWVVIHFVYTYMYIIWYLLHTELYLNKPEICECVTEIIIKKTFDNNNYSNQAKL